MTYPLYPYDAYGLPPRMGVIAACQPPAPHPMRHDGSMSATNTGQRRRPRGGIMRTRTTVRLLPKDKARYEVLADELGLSLTDTLAYYANIGAGIPIPPDIQMMIDNHKEAIAEGEMPPNQDPLVAVA